MCITFRKEKKKATIKQAASYYNKHIIEPDYISKNDTFLPVRKTKIVDHIQEYLDTILVKDYAFTC